MQDNKSEILKSKVEVLPKNIDIFFSDYESHLLSLTLPTDQEMQEFESGNRIQLSLKEISINDPLNLQQIIEDELLILDEKFKRFEHSTTYLNRLSNIKGMLGDLDSSRSYIEKALQIDQNPFLRHSLGNILISLGDTNRAKQVFLEADLVKDEFSNLRLAYLAAIESKISTAQEYLNRALSINPLSFKARMFQGAIHLWLGHWEEAIRNFKIAEDENSNSTALYVNLAAGYLGAGNREKSIMALKKALFIDPLNENAVTFISDILYLEERGEEAIFYLDKFVNYEQTSDALWGRVARAFYISGQKSSTPKQMYYKAIDALGNQASIRSTPSISNNIAVIYWALGLKSKAQRFFLKSIKDSYDTGEISTLALANLIGVLIDERKYQEAYRLVISYFQNQEKYSQCNDLDSRIKLQYIICLEARNDRKAASEKIVYMIENEPIESNIRLDLLNHLIFYHSAISPNLEILDKYIPIALRETKESKNLVGELISRVINNIVFAYIHFDKLDDAEFLLSKLNKSVHKDPYSTATLGLYNLKRGNFDRGKQLYEESVVLATSEKMKSRIRQRMYFEQGKLAFEKNDIASANRLYKKARKQKYGYKYLNSQIKLLPTK